MKRYPGTVRTKLPLSQIEKLRQIADVEGSNLSAISRKAIYLYIQEYEKQNKAA
jgi:hypothetical protein